MRDTPKTMHTANTSKLIRRIPWSEARTAEPEVLLTREWLVTNSLGGYAAGTVSGIPTRRYHGFLVAALPAPFGRMMLLPQLSKQLRLPDGTIVRLGGEERVGGAPQLYGAPPGPIRSWLSPCAMPSSHQHAGSRCSRSYNSVCLRL